MASADASPEDIKQANARGYQILYWESVLAGLAAGTVEAVINPVIATAYSHAKTKWLNILHAGWAGGLVLAGLLVLGMKHDGGLIGNLFENPIHWRWKVGVLLIPTVLYGLMGLRCRFPINERVVAGVSYRKMLSEVGGLGALIALGLVCWELGRVFGWPGISLGGRSIPLAMVLSAALALVFFAYTLSLGRPLFIFLLLIMVLLATTEIGTDGWISNLMRKPMKDSFNIDGGWVLVYSASIMLILRTFGGPVIKFLNPVGLLLVSCLFAAGGLMFLSMVTGVTIIVAATIYAIGQMFFWPTTLGLVAERFPKGGALTLNAMAGVDMLGVSASWGSPCWATSRIAISKRPSRSRPPANTKSF